MQTLKLGAAALAFLFPAATIQAAPLIFSLHQASGNGFADVSGGGPGVTGSGTTFGPTDPFMSFAAVDQSGTGSLNASAIASARSEIFMTTDDRLNLEVELEAAYLSSPFGGALNPGGSANSVLSSVIEFVMPQDALLWSYQLDIVHHAPYAGATNVKLQNLTQLTTALNLNAATTEVQTMLTAHAGDLMRLTTTMSGGGQTGPIVRADYHSLLDMRFMVPEPQAWSLMLLAVPALCRRKRG